MSSTRNTGPDGHGHLASVTQTVGRPGASGSVEQGEEPAGDKVNLSLSRQRLEIDISWQEGK